ncbi:MAG: DUF2188 domain-containing protein [Sphaerochaetaceae bacterium]|nr:DUF2188 domain-containing protein [Sphaerochaetaceae bacterium]
MTRKEQHVIPNGDRWGIKKDGAERCSKVFDRKSDAMDYGRDLARRQGAELIPHKKDGTIQNPNSYGNDSCPPKDRKH